jgi:hypothetical protein
VDFLFEVAVYFFHESIRCLFLALVASFGQAIRIEVLLVVVGVDGRIVESVIVSSRVSVDVVSRVGEVGVGDGFSQSFSY